MNFCDPQHNTAITDNLLNSFVERENIDLVFVCKENVQIHCHRIVFASVSEFLSGIMSKINQDVLYISIPDVEHTKLQILITFLYEGVTKISMDELVSLREIICFLGIRLFNTEVKSASDLYSSVDVCNIEQDINSSLLTPDEISTSGHSENNIYSSRGLEGNNATHYANVKGKMKTNLKSAEVPDHSFPYCSSEFLNCDDPAAPRASSMNFQTVKAEALPNDTTMYNKGPCDIVQCDSMAELSSETSAIDSTHVDTSVDPINTDDSVLPWECNVVISDVSSTTVGISENMQDDSDCYIVPDNEVMEFKHVPENFEEMPSPSQSTVSGSSTPMNESEISGRRKHVRLSAEQKSVLESSYNEEKFPDLEIREKLAQQLDIPCKTVTCWFTTRRLNDPSDLPVQTKKHFTKSQKSKLEMTYRNEGYPSKEVQEKLAEELNIPLIRVRNWFFTRRHKDSAEYQKCMEQLSPRQRDILERNYRADQIPSKYAQKKLAEELGISLDMITSWFMHRKIRRSGVCRTRRVFSKEQRIILQKIYKNNSYPDRAIQLKLAKDFGVTHKQVSFWFVNKRRCDESIPASRVCKKRTVLSAEHRNILETIYQSKGFQDREAKEKLSVELGIPFIQLRNWFLNRRSKDSTGPPQKSHARFTSEERALLEEAYAKDNVPSKQARMELAKQLGLQYERVRCWFINRRNKDKEDGQEVPQRSHYRLEDNKRAVLEEAYSNDKFPSQDARTKLAQQLGLSYNKVCFWFINKRNRDKEINQDGSQKSYYRLDDDKRAILELSYATNRFPSKEARMELAAQLDLSYERVRCWFINKRNRDKDECGLSTNKPLFTPEEESLLEKALNIDGDPSEDVLMDISDDTGIPFKKVKFWLENKQNCGQREFSGVQRIHFTEEQKKILEDYYSKDKHPDMDMRTSIAKQLNVTYDRVRLWFINRRRKDPDESQTPSTNRFTEQEKAFLEKAYSENGQPEKKDMVRIAQELRVPFSRIRYWFSNRKAKDKSASNMNLRSMSKRTKNETLDFSNDESWHQFEDSSDFMDNINTDPISSILGNVNVKTEIEHASHEESMQTSYSTDGFAESMLTEEPLAQNTLEVMKYEPSED